MKRFFSAFRLLLCGTLLLPGVPAEALPAVRGAVRGPAARVRPGAPAPALSAALLRPAAVFAAARLPPLPSAAVPAAPARRAPERAESRLDRSLRRLSAPAALSRLPPRASAEASRGGGEEEFAQRLGEGAGAGRAEAALVRDSSRAGPARLAAASPRRAFAAGAPAGGGHSKGPAPAAPRRSALFWLGPAAAAGAASAALAFAAGALGSWAEAGALSEAALRAAFGGAVGSGALSGAFAVSAAREAWAYAAAMRRGRGAGGEELSRFLLEETRAGRLDHNAAALVRPYRSRYWDFSFGAASGGLAWVRPELTASPELLRKVLAHELSHLEDARAPRGPPRRGRLLAGFRAELKARRAERRPGPRVVRSSLLTRILRQAQISLRLAEPYDILVVNPGREDLSDPGLYAGLSDGAARVTTFASKAPLHSFLGTVPGRYRAVVLGGLSGALPGGATPEGRRMSTALRKLDSLYVLASRLQSRGEGFAPGSAEAEAWAGLEADADRLRRLGGDRERKAFEAKLKRVWSAVAAERLKGLEAVRIAQGLYDGLRDRGTAFAYFGPGEDGVETWEKLLRYWEAADGGRFRAARVDLEDGSHVLVLRKVEPRVGLWLRPLAGGRIERSVSNAAGAAESSRAARKALEEAGFRDQLKLFDELGVSVKYVFGADLSRQEIYVTVPRRHAEALRRFSGAASVRVAGERARHGAHLPESADLHALRPVWRLGITGAAGSILWADTGAQSSHGDYGDRLEVADLVDEGPEDWHGHGSHVAGISIAGVAPFLGPAKGARGVMAKVFSRDTPGAADGDIMGAAIVALERGVDVVSLSLGSRGTSADNISEFFTQLAQVKFPGRDAPIVTASMGNAGPFDRSGSQPAAGAGVLAVAAAAKSLDDGRPEIAFYSSVGFDEDPRYAVRRRRLKPQLAAIGGDVVTAPGSPNVYRHGVKSAKSQDAPASPSDLPDGRHTALSGTSMANPMAAGIALLVKLAMKSFGGASAFVRENIPFAVGAVLMRSAADLGVPPAFQGAGLVQAWAAARLVAAEGRRALIGRLRAAAARLGLARAVPSSSRAWGWVERLKALQEAEDAAFREAELPRSVASARLLEAESAEAAPPDEGEEPAADEEPSARLRFARARDAALPAALSALRDPVWLVRFMAAFTLLNLGPARAAGPLAEAALHDSDARVRRMAFLALSEAPAGPEDALLREAARRGGSSDAVYAAFALARRGEAEMAELAAAGLESPDKTTRFTAAWLLGQYGPAARSFEAEALSARVRDSSERGNIRHLAAASLSNIAAAAPGALSDRAAADLLSAAGRENMALARTIGKVFPAALRDKAFAERVRSGSLRPAAVAFVLKNRDLLQLPGALGELAVLLARAADVPLEAPTPPWDPSGAGVAGVDPALGPVDIIVRAPARGRLVPEIEKDLLGRHFARLKARFPVSGAAWLSVPPHKVYALTVALQARGLRVQPSRALYPSGRLDPVSADQAEAFFELDERGEAPASGEEEASWVRLRAVAGLSEARAMAVLEKALARTGPAGPAVVSLALAAPGRGRGPWVDLLEAAAARGALVVVGAGDAGPAEGSLEGTARAAGVLAIAAAGPEGLAFYSARGKPGEAPVAWAERVDALAPGSAAPPDAVLGTAAAAERAAAKLAALARLYARACASAGRPLPSGWAKVVSAHARAFLTPLPGAAAHEAGGGIFDRFEEALSSWKERLGDLDALEREAAGAPGPAA